MPRITRVVTVTDELTEILPASSKRESYVIRNLDDELEIKIGGPDVDFADGFPLKADEIATEEAIAGFHGTGMALYGIADENDSVEISVIEMTRG